MYTQDYVLGYSQPSLRDWSRAALAAFGRPPRGQFICKIRL